MVAMRHVAVAGLLCCAAGLVGCQEKKVMLTFTNTNSNAISVKLVERDIAGMPIGSVPGNGGKLRYKIEIDKDFLPIDYTMETAEYPPHKFSIDVKTKSKLWIHITPTGIIGPVGEDDVVRHTYENQIKDRPVGREEVVE